MHLRLGGGGDDELDRELPAAGQRRREWRHACGCRDAVTFACTSGSNLEDRALALAPRLEHQAAEAVVGEGDLEALLRLPACSSTRG